MITLWESATTSRDSRTVSPSAENLTAVSSSACKRPYQQVLVSHDKVLVRRWRGERHVARDSANSVVPSIARLSAAIKETGADLNGSPLTSI